MEGLPLGKLVVGSISQRGIILLDDTSGEVSFLPGTLCSTDQVPRVQGLAHIVCRWPSVGEGAIRRERFPAIKFLGSCWAAASHFHYLMLSLSYVIHDELGVFGFE